MKNLVFAVAMLALVSTALVGCRGEVEVDDTRATLTK